MKTNTIAGLVALSLLAACAPEAETPAPETSETSAGELPEGFTLPTGTTIASEQRIDIASGEGWVAYLDSTLSVAQLESHFVGEAEAAGFSTEFRPNSGGQRQLYGNRDDGMMLDLSVMEFEGGSRASIAIGREK